MELSFILQLLQPKETPPNEVVKLLNEIKIVLEGQGGLKYWPAIIGMFGVIIGALVTGSIQFRIAKINQSNDERKIRADIVTKQRQEWMDSIRDAAVQLFLAWDIIYNAKTTNRISDQDKDKAVLDALTNASIIRLKLNIEKDTSKHLYQKIVNLHKLVLTGNDLPQDEYRKQYLFDKAILEGVFTELFNETWDKIKALK